LHACGGQPLSPDRDDRVRVPSYGRRRQRSCRELDHEGSRSWTGVVLPTDHAAGLAGEPGESQPRERCEPPLDRQAASGLGDEVHVLVEPDRDLRPRAPDQPDGDPALRLGQWPYPRVEEAGQALPPPGKVAIEIDAAVVAAGVGGDAVRVEVGDDPEVCFTRWCDMGESAGDRDPCWLVAVDAADDEDALVRIEVAGLNRDDWAAID